MDIVKPNQEAPGDETPQEPTASNAGTVVSDPLSTLKLKPQVIEVVSTVYDPEIPVNIYELGLIYDITVDATGLVSIRMTLTSPACPAAQSLPVEVVGQGQGHPGCDRREGGRGVGSAVGQGQDVRGGEAPARAAVSGSAPRVP